MRLLTDLILFLVAGASHAGCSQIAGVKTETLFIDIGTRGCATRDNMISFATKKSSDKEFADLNADVPFVSECVRTKDGFACRPNGKTPLAGATYRKTQFGRSTNACAKAGELGEKYICIEGCDKPSVPMYLNGDDGSC